MKCKIHILKEWKNFTSIFCTLLTLCTTYKVKQTDFSDFIKFFLNILLLHSASIFSSVLLQQCQQLYFSILWMNKLHNIGIWNKERRKKFYFVFISSWKGKELSLFHFCDMLVLFGVLQRIVKICSLTRKIWKSLWIPPSSQSRAIIRKFCADRTFQKCF